MGALYYLVAAIAVVAIVYVGYKWYSSPKQLPPSLPDTGAYLIRSDSLYGGYPSPLLYKKRAENEYVLAMYDPMMTDTIVTVNTMELQAFLDNYKEKYDVLHAPHMEHLVTAFRDNILAYQSKLLFSEKAEEVELAGIPPADLLEKIITFINVQLN